MPELVYPAAIAAARTSFRLLGLRVDVQGTGHIPPSGGAVVASNHTSFLDFIFVGFPAEEQGRRRIRFMAKDAIFAHPVAGPLMRNMKHIPVDRNAGSEAYKQGLRALKSGELLGVFPEATMSRSMQLKEFKSGAARLAASAGVPLVPVVVFGTARMLSYQHRDLTSRGTAISIRVGEPLYPGRRDDAEEVTATLKARMALMLDDVLATYPQRPDDPAAAWWWPASLGGGAPSAEEAAAIDQRVAQEKAAAREARQRQAEHGHD